MKDHFCKTPVTNHKNRLIMLGNEKN